MKTIEEKAKAYDEALERAKEWSSTKNGYYTPEELCKEIFPELVESKGEKIRKLLISGMKNLNYNAETFASIPIKDVIDWLEKRRYSEFELENEYWRGYREGKQEVIDKYAELEKQREQRPIIVRFKIGDVIKDISCGKTYTIIRYIKNGIAFVDNKGEEFTKYYDEDDWDAYELIEQKPAWSEEDEKNLLEINCLIGNYRTGDDEYKLESWLKSLKDRCIPQSHWKPTEEQKPAGWSAEDEIRLNEIIQIVESNGGWIRSEDAVKLNSDWLKDLKDRVQPKQEWNEEDRRLIKFLIAHFSVCHANRSFKFDNNTDLLTDEIIERIRNLSPQNHWKPSDEQMKALGVATNIANVSEKEYLELEKLYNDLKAL